MYKYRINELLCNLPQRDYHKALKIIPGALRISINTFLNYRNIKLTEERDIPHQKVVILEKIFNLEAGGLENFKIEFKQIHELLAEHADKTE